MVTIRLPEYDVFGSSGMIGKTPKRTIASAAIALPVLLFMCQIASLAQANSSGTSFNIMNFGAKGNGSDDTAALQAALNAAGESNGQAYFPCGVYGVSSPLEVLSYVRMDDCAIIRALVPMNAVVQIGSVNYLKDGWFRGGIIDANNFANDGLFLRQYAHFNVVDTEVLNARMNGFHLGDPSLSGSSYEAILSRVQTRRTTGTAVSGSTGLFIDSNATDSNITNAVFTGSDVGIRTLTGGNFFTDIHVWSPPSAGWMTVGFDDYGSGNFWKGCESDTVEQYGMVAHRFNTVIQGCRFYNNNIYALDNTAVGISFDQASPYATVTDSVFMGQDSSHRLAQDMNVAVPTTVQRSGNQYVNVTQHY